MANVRTIHPDDSARISAVNKIENDHPSLDALLKIEEHLKATVGPVTWDAIAADCKTQFKAVHDSGLRPLSVIDLIVVHDTEGGTSRSVAQYFTNDAAGGSTQLVVDDNSCYRCLADNQIPWGAPGANYNGFHIEQCGYAKWTTTMWSSTHRRTLMRAAYKTAYHCRKYGISVRFLTATDLKAGKRNGITTHHECSVAFGGTHHDPGTGWPRVLFMTMVRGYYVALFRVKKVA